ncbi:MAG: hypothetical protein ACREJQ_05070, partial [bacterium]
QEDIETKVSNLYLKIQSPVLTTPELEFDGIAAYDTYPKNLNDLFAGSQVVITGRFEKAGKGSVVLRGMMGDAGRRFTFPVAFPRMDNKHAFIPRIWATQKIGHLLDEVRLKGETPELIESIKTLSKKYGILTPYTAFLVQEPGTPMPLTREEAQALGGSFARNGSAGGAQYELPAPPPVAVGRSAQKASADIRDMKEADKAASSPVDRVKTVGTRTFFLRNGRWEQTEYKEEKTRKIKFLSDEYFDLFKKHEDLKDVLVIGDHIVFKVDMEFIEVIPEVQ